MQINTVTLALDVGTQRIGVARVHPVARIASPLTTLNVTDTIMTDIAKLIKDEDAGLLVVGLPRGMQGQETEQTTWLRQFVADLEKQVSIPVVLQDEAVTSEKAEVELKKRGKPYAKGDIDALAATYILEDYLSS